MFVVPGPEILVTENSHMTLRKIFVHPRRTDEAEHGFCAVAGFQRVIGVTDYAHEQLVPPVNTEHVYRNRKHTSSLNVEIVCDANCVTTNVVAKYSGSVHDLFILRNSVIFSNLRDGCFQVSHYKTCKLLPLHDRN